MTHQPQTLTLPIRTLAAALVLVAALSAGLAIAVNSLELPSFGPANPAQPIVSPASDAIMDAARQWERERRQQAGTDHLMDAGRGWERQRHQQTPR